MRATQAEKTVIQHGIDYIGEMISSGDRCEPEELHNRVYNEDYFIIGTYKAEKFLEEYGVFAAIQEIKEYEQDNFGEVTTDFSSSESVANMFAYIKGEEALNACKTLQKVWDDGELSEDDLIAIKKELEGQL